MTPGVGAAATRAVGFVLALAAGLLSFTTPALVSGEPEGELRVGVARLPDPLDPIGPMPAGAGVVFRHVFQGLVDVGERGDIEPGLAAQWSVSRDGLIWTFRLRPDVQFHNGVPLTADVVVASLARLPLGDEAAAREADEPWLGLFRGKSAVVREIRRGDRGTVQMVLAQPFSPLLAALAHPALAIVVTERDSPVPVLGTGPYKVAERSAGRLVLEAVPGASEPPRVAKLVFEEVSDAAAGLAELGPGGRLDVLFPRVPPAWGGLGLQVLSGPTWQLGVLALRTHEGVAGRKPVRRAIAASLDPALVGPALGRMARPYAGYLPPLAWAVRPPPATPHEPIRARRLLAESGNAGAALTLLVPEQRDELEPARLAEAVRLSLAVAGLTLKVRPAASAAYEPALRSGEGELALAEVALPLDDPHFLLRPLVSSDAAVPGSATNVAFYRNPVADGLLLRASQIGFRPERLRLYHRLQAQLAEDLPYIPLYVRLQWAVSRPGVRDLRLDPGGRHRLDRVRVPSQAPAPAGDVAPSR
jgi:peptide/nickel transport system substrate-binding protein